MVPGRFQVIKLAVQRVRQPRYRMPVSGIVGRHRPSHRVPGQSVLDVLVIGDVNVVVVVDESVGSGGIVKRQAKDERAASA